MNNRQQLLMAWVEGRYALGWRGWLAMKLLTPVLNEVLSQEKEQLWKLTSLSTESV